MALLAEIFPAFYGELRRSLMKLKRSDLADQLPGLTLERWTHDPGIGVYITVGGTRPLNIVEQYVIGVKHGESIKLDDCDGLVVIDTDNFARVTGIEVMGRRDVLKALRRAHPPAPPAAE